MPVRAQVYRVDNVRILVEDCSARLVATARSNAKRSNVEFGLDDASISRLWDAQGGCCAVSGLEFTDEEFPEALVKRPFAPSADRIVPGGGYLQGNVRLVCVCANLSMNEWGVDTLIRLADAVVNFHRKHVIKDPSSPCGGLDRRDASPRRWLRVTEWRLTMPRPTDDALLVCAARCPFRRRAFDWRPRGREAPQCSKQARQRPDIGRRDAPPIGLALTARCKTL